MAITDFVASHHVNLKEDKVVVWVGKGKRYLRKGRKGGGRASRDWHRA